jgi:hypothetical protein
VFLLARGLLDKPIERTCSNCNKSFVQKSTKGSDFCCFQCKHDYRLKFDLDYKLNRLLHGSKTRASSKALPFNLTLKYLKELYEEQEGLCAVTNKPFCFTAHPTKHVADKDSVSLDRIDPELGYTKRNVRFVTFQVNCAKGFYTDEEFYEMCANALRNRL